MIFKHRAVDDDLGTVVGTESCFSPFFSFHAFSPLSYELLLLNNNGPWASTSTHRAVINHKRSVAFCNSTRRSPDLAIELHACVCVLGFACESQSHSYGQYSIVYENRDHFSCQYNLPEISFLSPDIVGEETKQSIISCGEGGDIL